MAAESRDQPDLGRDSIGYSHFGSHCESDLRMESLHETPLQQLAEVPQLSQHALAFKQLGGRFREKLWV